MVERSHLAPYLYFVRLEIDPKKGQPFLNWLSSKHIKDVVGNPGFLWARRVPLDEPAADGWKRVLIVYGIDTRNDYLAYKGSEAFQRYKEECRQFEGTYRVERYSGQVDLVFD